MRKCVRACTQHVCTCVQCWGGVCGGWGCEHALTLQMCVSHPLEYQGERRGMSVCVCSLCVFSRGNSNSALAAQMCCMVLWNLNPPPAPPHTHTHIHTPPTAAPSPSLSSKPAQNSALRHMWKQFSQCPEQGSPHTHTHTHRRIRTENTHISHSPL